MKLKKWLTKVFGREMTDAEKLELSKSRARALHDAYVDDLNKRVRKAVRTKIENPSYKEIRDGVVHVRVFIGMDVPNETLEYVKNTLKLGVREKTGGYFYAIGDVEV